MLNLDTKVCIGCQEELPVTDFYKKSGSTGFRSRCKTCYTKDSVERAKRKGYRTTPKVRQEVSKRYYLNNKDLLIEKQRTYRDTNREALNAKRREKYAEDPTTVKRYVHKRRTLKANCEGEFTDLQWKVLLSLCGSKCLRCNSDRDITVDHIIPLSLGGSNSIQNIQPLCRSCNAWKHIKIIDFRVCTII